jgi:hypothetical protein
MLRNGSTREVVEDGSYQNMNLKKHYFSGALVNLKGA